MFKGIQFKYFQFKWQIIIWLFQIYRIWKWQSLFSLSLLQIQIFSIQNERLSLCYCYLSNTWIEQLLRTFEVLVSIQFRLRNIQRIVSTSLFVCSRWSQWLVPFSNCLFIKLAYFCSYCRKEISSMIGTEVLVLKSQKDLSV